jgi:hypothetical protein
MGKQILPDRALSVKLYHHPEIDFQTARPPIQTCVEELAGTGVTRYYDKTRCTREDKVGVAWWTELNLPPVASNGGCAESSWYRRSFNRVKKQDAVA